RAADRTLRPRLPRSRAGAHRHHAGRLRTHECEPRGRRHRLGRGDAVAVVCTADLAMVPDAGPRALSLLRGDAARRRGAWDVRLSRRAVGATTRFLVDRVGPLQVEGRDLAVEAIAVVGDHLV